MKPLSVGNVVSAGLRIYRNNFAQYYRLALIGSLWGLIPIYGTAKFYAQQALIARLAYGEVIEQPEDIKDANRFVKGRMWRFLGAALLVFLRFILAYILGAIAIALVGGALTMGILALTSLVFGDSGTIVGTIVSSLIYLAIFILFLGYLIRLFASFSVSELILAKEENVNASEALRQSRELTQGHLRSLVLVYLVASLVSFPLISLILTIQILPLYLQESYPILASEIFSLVRLIFNTVTAALIVPFWQSIKAVIYYDLKVRREGMGLDLRK